MEERARYDPESSLSVSGKRERSRMQILFMNQFILEIFALLGCYVPQNGSCRLSGATNWSHREGAGEVPITLHMRGR